jgi:hypothetical protein
LSWQGPENTVHNSASCTQMRRRGIGAVAQVRVEAERRRVDLPRDVWAGKEGVGDDFAGNGHVVGGVHSLRGEGCLCGGEKRFPSFVPYFILFHFLLSLSNLQVNLTAMALTVSPRSRGQNRD